MLPPLFFLQVGEWGLSQIIAFGEARLVKLPPTLLGQEPAAKSRGKSRRHIRERTVDGTILRDAGQVHGQDGFQNIHIWPISRANTKLSLIDDLN